MPGPPQDDPGLWDQLSPLTQASADAPPFLVIAGPHDALYLFERFTAAMSR